MKVFVSGATGFIGQYVVEELLKNKHEVVASYRSDKKLIANWQNKVNYISFDLEKFDSTVNYFKLFGEPDLMIHLAWEGLPDYLSSFHFEINLPRHEKFLNNLINGGLKDITITGTCLEYGMQEGCLNEDLPSLPANPYALAKDSLRKYLQELQMETTFNLKWVRLFYMYGKGQHPNSLLSQLENAIANNKSEFNMSLGEQVRDYLPVEKVAEYIVKIACQQKIQGIINCCSGQPVILKEFVLDYLEKNNKNIKLNLGYYPYADYEPMRFWGDNKKLQNILKNSSEF